MKPKRIGAYMAKAVAERIWNRRKRGPNLPKGRPSREKDALPEDIVKEALGAFWAWRFSRL